MIYTRRQRIWNRKHRKLIYTILFLAFIAGFFTGGAIVKAFSKPQMISPCPENGCFEPQPTKISAKIEATTSPNQLGHVKIGKASYYSVAGCLGCNPTATMANGQRLDDTKPTVAYNHLPLNTSVKITNVKNGKSITVLVTDRGGFERHGKIADLSLATKNALQCGDVCDILLVK